MMLFGPFPRPASAGALNHLCAGNRFTCWAGGQVPPGLCPLIDANGHLQFQGCHQHVRFVCRTKGEQAVLVPYA